PGPFTCTWRWRMPSSAALRAAASAATCAANGVPLREPLKPHCPALDQTSTFPCWSATVTVVLLNVEWMCSTPSATTRCDFFRRAGAAAASAAGAAPLPEPPSGSFAMSLLTSLRRRHLLAGDRLPGPFARARVRVRALAAHGQILPMPEPAVAAEVD